MEVLATLADAPTAVIAVIAIMLGLLFAARGPRGERRSGGGADEAAPVMLADVPVAPPSGEPGFVGPEGSIVGHGPIHLGGGGPLAGPAAPEAPAEPLDVGPDASGPVAPEPSMAAPIAQPEPDQIAQPESEPAGPPAPADAPRPIPFKQGTIRLRPADPPTDS